MPLQQLQKKVDALAAARERACQRVREERDSLTAARGHLAAATQAQQVVQAVAQSVQRRAHEQVVSVVTRCLQTVFDDPKFGFRIAFDKKRGRTEARLLFTRGGKEEDPTEAGSGGAVDVAALALRLACLCLSRPRRRKLLVLDEPFKHVHGAGNRKRVAELLLALAKEFGVQIVMATGLEYLKVGHVIDLEDV